MKHKFDKIRVAPGTLVLAEKPSVARDIARVLKCNRKAKGYFENDKYIVTWALGHLVTLADPEEYNKKYKAWKLDDLPILPDKMKLSVIRQSSGQFYKVKDLMNRKDVGEIILATDSGREGELVGRWIIEKANVRKPIKRLWISSVTDKAIRDGFKNLKDGRDYENLYYSAVARAEADWIVGINATRALTTKYNSQLSCGRVQTPTLAIIAQREKEINDFIPRDYYGIAANTKELKLIWQDKGKNTRTFNREYVDKLLSTLEGKNARIIDINKILKKTFSPKLYDLTELQRDANRLFDYSAKETLSIMQRLYEYHKILTYPRTDSRYISDDIMITLKDRLKAIKINPYDRFVNRIMAKPIKASKSFVDNSKITDHHAIIPTEQNIKLSELNEKERKILDLVVRRFLAVLYPPFEYEHITINTQIGEESFIAKGKRIIKKGFKEIYLSIDEDSGEGDIEEQIIPLMDKEDMLKVISIKRTSGKTRPPAPFNEGTLLSAMENPTKYMDTQNKELAKVLGDAGGIGTVATRADIIEKLFNTFLIENRGKDIFITGKGRQLLELVPEELKAPDLTGEWEKKLDLIAKGKLNRKAFIGEMKEYSKTLIKDIRRSNHKFRHDNITRAKCPECNRYMLEVKTKKGKMYICQDRECGYRQSISKITNARCPNCKKRLELRGEGEGQIFICSCGYREKLSIFNERKKGEKRRINKKEVSRYLKEQEKKDGNINTDLADALSKLKF